MNEDIETGQTHGRKRDQLLLNLFNADNVWVCRLLTLKTVIIYKKAVLPVRNSPLVSIPK